MADSVETAVYKLRVEGQAEIDRLTKSVDGLAVAEEKATASNRTFSQALQNNVARIDPLVRAQEQYRKALETNLRYRETGVGTEAQLNAQLEASTKRYQQQVSVINQVEKATVSHTNAQKLQRYELINFGRQMQDIGVSLFSGQSPLTVGVQQIPQALDAITSSGVGAGNALKQIGTIAAGFVLSLGGAVAGVAALAAGVAYLAIQWDNADKARKQALIGAGARTGTTETELAQFAQRSATPGGPSGSQLDKFGQDLTRTGDIAVARLNEMGIAVQGFATLTNKSFAEAADAIVKFATDPQKALDELSKTYGAFSSQTRKAVDAAIEAGDKTKALQIIWDSLRQKNEEAIATIDLTTEAWRRLRNQFSVPIRVPGTLQQQLEAKRGELEAVKSAPITEFSDTIGQTIQLRSEIEKLQAQIAKGVDANKITEQFNATEQAIERATKAQTRMMPVAEAVGGAAKLAAQYAVDYANAVDQGAKAEVAAATATANRALAQAQINAAAKETLFSLQNQAAAAGAVTGAQQMAAAAAATYNQMVHDGVDATIAEAVAAQQLANAHAQATANVIRQVETLKDSTQMIRAQTADLGTGSHQQEAATAAAIAYKNAVESGASSTAAAALSTQTLANYAAKAAQEFEQLRISANQAAIASAQAASDTMNAAAAAAQLADQVNRTMIGTPGSPKRYTFQPNDLYPVSYRGGGTGMRLSTGVSNIAALPSYGNPDEGRLIYGIVRGVEGFYNQSQIDAAKKTTPLTDSIDKLKDSTDALNATNQELLSPYYTQDPRTSHIGFRSQGMAMGGYVDVPGGYSSNDNMIATVPVASGERIYIDPMNNRRSSGSGGGMVINISSPINIYGNADKDQFGRTVYQANQQLAKQVRAATQ